MSTKLKELQKQRKDAILKLREVLKGSEEGIKALDSLIGTAGTMTFDHFALRKIVDMALIAAKETYSYPTTDSKEVQAYLFASGIESVLLSQNIIPPFVIKKGRF